MLPRPAPGALGLGQLRYAGGIPRNQNWLFGRNLGNKRNHSKVTGLVAIVTAAAGGATVQSQGWAVRLDVAQPVAVVALLG